MGRAGRLFAAGAVLVALAGGAALLLGKARAQDGLPFLTGIWTGDSKGHAYSLDGTGPAGPSKVAFAADITQSEGGPGNGVNADVTIGITPPATVDGYVGNGTFWAVSGDPSAPVLVVGHVDAGATKMKGSVLSGGPASALDTKFKAGK
jgi:hypothetical protein